MTIAVRTDLGAGGSRSDASYDRWHEKHRVGKRGVTAVPIRTGRGTGFTDAEMFFDLPAVPDMSMEAYRELPDGSGARIVEDGTPVYLVLPDPDGSLRPFLTRSADCSGGSYWFDEHDDPRFDDAAREALASAASEVGLDVGGLRDGALARTVQRFLVDEGGRAFADLFSAMSGYRAVRRVGRNMHGETVDRWLCVCEGTKENDAHFVDATGHGGWLCLAATVGKAEVVEDLPPRPAPDLAQDPAARLALAWIDRMPNLYREGWIATLRERTYGPSPDAEAGIVPGT